MRSSESVLNTKRVKNVTQMRVTDGGGLGCNLPKSDEDEPPPQKKIDEGEDGIEKSKEVLK